jgi:CRP-like cAMP-binding protein
MATSLASIPLFGSLEEVERERLATVCSEIDVDAGTTLVHEGDFGFAMYAIVAGSAEVTQSGEVIRTLGAGDVFGEVAVLSGGRRTATVTATSPMRLVAVMNRDVWRLEREHPDTGAALRQTITDCLARSASR